MKAINIKWDVEYYANTGKGMIYMDYDLLPEETEIPEGMSDGGLISSYISDLAPGVLLVSYELVD